MSSKDEHQRVQQIKSYVLARLREELHAAPRGAQARLAKKLGVSGAHLSNMLSPHPTRQPGEDFRRKMAVHWGLSYATLEALALGEEDPAAGKVRLPFVAELPPELASVLADYKWLPEITPSLRLVVREQARQHVRFGAAGLDRDDWQRIVTGLEREALALMARRKSDPPPSGPKAPVRNGE